MNGFDVLVVGGGHAGVEAALAATRMGARTGLVTFDARMIGAMSCNPAIGGLGKGHLTREVDALDGVLARAADRAAIHYRMLNESKGRAVQGPRVQADRTHFLATIQTFVRQAAGLTVIQGEAFRLEQKDGAISGLQLHDGTILKAPAIVLATGTFLNGRLFCGQDRDQGGRVGEEAANGLGDQLRALALPIGRLKTGTPPRLDGRTIDWARLARQPSDARDWTFSPLECRRLPQLACFITRTNGQTHDAIRTGLGTSPLFGGAIAGRGPRYCPSIEDKIVRFGDRDGHQIFLEPEGLASHWIYPNGLSTSLDRTTQDRLIASISGLERAVIAQYGYAVEYDYLDPRALDHRLASRALQGLFCAGQINGTTGYEEAAAQGLVAGVNAAALALGRPPFVLQRTDSYIGVMIDDLVLQGITEPYRMLTARAEFRLRLRVDNAASRLTDHGIAAGCVSATRAQWWTARRQQLESLHHNLTPAHALEARRSGWTGCSIRQALDLADDIDIDLLDEVAEDLAYAPYVERQIAEQKRLAASDALRLPPLLDYRAMPGLSHEMVERLTAARPDTLGAARRINGITPAALAMILVAARKGVVDGAAG